MRMQASLLGSAALTAKVDTLKQNLARTENELVHAKRQLEENKGKRFPARMYLKIGKIG